MSTGSVSECGPERPDEPVPPRNASVERLLALDEALTQLQELDDRSAKVIELRFFAGLSEEDAAKALNISLATLKRDWDFARTWLASRLKDDRQP